MDVSPEKLRAVAQRVELAEFRLRQAQQARDVLIIAATKAGYASPRLAQLVGVTEGRVRQINRAGLGAIDGRVNGHEARIQLDEEGEFVGAVVLYEDETGFEIEEV